MRTFYFIILALFAVSTVSTRAQDVDWIKQLKANAQFANAAHSDASGNFYVTGYFGGPLNLGTQTLVGGGTGDMFLVKYDGLGRLQWAAQSESAGWDGGRDITTDASGNVYCAGRIDGQSRIGSATLNAVGGNDATIVKYNSNGSVVWARSGGGSGRDWSNGVALDPAGNIFVTGLFVGSATFGGRNISGNGDNDDIFLVKYDANGGVLWALGCGGSETEGGHDVAVDADGNAYVVGWFSGTARFGDISLTAVGDFDGFVMKVTPGGSVEWVRRIGAGANDSVDDVDIQDNGNIIVSGYFNGSACDVGDQAVLEGSGTFDIVVAGFTPEGNVDFATKIGGNGNDGQAGFGQGSSIKAGPDGKFWLTTSFGGVLNFGFKSITSRGDVDILTGYFNSDGSPIWYAGCGGSAYDNFLGMGVAPNGDVFIVGNYFSDPLICGEVNLPHTNSQFSSFVARIKQGEPVPDDPALGLETEELDFGDVELGQSKSLSLELTSLSTAALEIQGIEFFDLDAESKGLSITAPDLGSLPVELSQDESITVTIEFAPTVAEEMFSDLLISTNDPNKTAVLVTLTGMGVEASGQAQIELSTNDIDFGDVEIGSSMTSDVVISSVGSEALQVTMLELGATAADMGFSIVAPDESQLPVTLQPSETLTVSISFDPQAAGEVVSQLVVGSNAVDDPQLTVALRGNGEEPDPTSVHELQKSLNGLTASLPQGNIVGAQFPLSISLSVAETVELVLVDINGNSVKHIGSRALPSGSHQLQIDVSDLAQGVYFLQLRSGSAQLALPLTLRAR